ncbi:hypothetical protein Tco_0209587 [Tanacetum coccineum]
MKLGDLEEGRDEIHLITNLMLKNTIVTSLALIRKKKRRKEGRCVLLAWRRFDLFDGVLDGAFGGVGDEEVGG